MRACWSSSPLAGEWAVGSAEAVAGHELDGQMAKMLEAIAKAGSWAAWMGVFQPEWMQLLKAGGMGHSRARKLTTRLAQAHWEEATAKAPEERGGGEGGWSLPLWHLPHPPAPASQEW